MMRRLIAIVIAVLFLGGLIAYSQFRPQPNHVSGFIEADEIRVGSRVGGRVRAVLVEEGDRVTKGQVLVELEPFDLLERENEAIEILAARDAEYRRLAAGLRPEEIAQAKARYDQFKARLDLLEEGPREQEIDAARGRLRAAEAELKLAQKNYERVAELFQKNAVSRQDFDKASEQLEAAQASVVVRKEELELLEAGTREEEIREAGARVAEAEQAWQLAQKGKSRGRDPASQGVPRRRTSSLGCDPPAEERTDDHLSGRRCDRSPRLATGRPRAGRCACLVGDGQ